MDFELETKKLTRKGITISKPLCILIIFGTILVFVSLIVGLTLGLKKNDCEQSDEQKYETCLDLNCRNTSLFFSEFSFLVINEIKL